jgi:hypothetical protein
MMMVPFDSAKNVSKLGPKFFKMIKMFALSNYFNDSGELIMHGKAIKGTDIGKCITFNLGLSTEMPKDYNTFIFLLAQCKVNNKVINRKTPILPIESSTPVVNAVISEPEPIRRKKKRVKKVAKIPEKVEFEWSDDE